ncbi:hypothetical protein RND71_042332 [Anisodus tanguticus]|uniref:Uncharacterized protein n=1 Tax=Anisodus tanguticus TaxID=243964 RepID=A0AAE1QQR4_9SOLA|nr:hypothetical protein RND71_042332 [Anisodus tanguticus]
MISNYAISNQAQLTNLGVEDSELHKFAAVDNKIPDDSELHNFATVDNKIANVV